MDVWNYIAVATAAFYVHCQTSIVSDLQTFFLDEFAYEGNRAIHFMSSDDPPTEKLDSSQSARSHTTANE